MSKNIATSVWVEKGRLRFKEYEKKLPDPYKFSPLEKARIKILNHLGLSLIKISNIYDIPISQVKKVISEPEERPLIDLGSYTKKEIFEMIVIIPPLLPQGDQPRQESSR